MVICNDCLLSLDSSYNFEVFTSLPKQLVKLYCSLSLINTNFLFVKLYFSCSLQYLFCIIHDSCRCDGLCCSFQATDSLRVDVRATLCQACAWRRGLGRGFASCHPPGHTTTTLPGSHLGRPGRQQLLPRRGQCRIVINYNYHEFYRFNKCSLPKHTHF